MSAIAFTSNPYLATPINAANQAQTIVQQSQQAASAATALGLTAAPVRNQTLQAVNAGGQSDASRSLRNREEAKASDGGTGRLTAENNAASAARGGRRPGSQIDILV